MSARGSCLCGAVRYRVGGPLRPVIACHCTQCRKTSGHHVAATSAPRATVTVEGAEAIRWFESSPGVRRGFCGTCGAPLFWDKAACATLSIFAGTLDDAPGLALAGHIFCADKGTYYAVADGLPQAEGAHPALTTQG
jgi:Uncharacterized conserved protein